MTESKNHVSDDRPPVFSTWRQMYIFVLLLHVVILCLFYFITQHFA